MLSQIKFQMVFLQEHQIQIRVTKTLNQMIIQLQPWHLHLIQQLCLSSVLLEGGLLHL